MTLNTAQYLAPLNSQQVLSGYAQGVKEGTGVTIQTNGTITLDTAGATSLGFLISSTIPAPVLSWPTAPGQAGALLQTDSSGNLNWSVNYVPTAPSGGTFPQTGAAILPVGPTSAQPSSPARGYIRYNSDSENLEWYNGIVWSSVTPPSGGVYSFVSTVAPTANNPGDFWYDQNFQQEKVWNGLAWVPTTPIATTTSLGTVQIGSNVQVTSGGVVSVPSTVGISGGVSNFGVTAIVDNTGSLSTSEALSANQGRLLQAQIGSLIASANITLAGTINGSGILLTVTNVASLNGFVVGDPLPAPSATNIDFFVLCTAAGTFTPTGGSAISVTTGDWLLSDGAAWLFLNVGYDPPIASTTQAGLVELATDAEVQTGTDTSRAVTPSGLTSRVATTTQTGLIELATVAEVQTGTDNTRAVTPLGLTNRIASETLSGIAEIATQAEVDGGVDDTRIVTPLKLKTALTNGAISAATLQLSPAINGNTTVQQALQDAVYNIASASGEVLVTETATGQIDLNLRDATETLTGVSEVATQAEVDAGTDDFRYVTPLKLSAFISGGQVTAPEIPLSPAINGNTTVQSALNDAIYNIDSPGASVTVTEAATGQVTLAVTQASETQLGGAEIATQAETNAGLSNSLIVTPQKLVAYVGSGLINATTLSLSPAINGNTTVQQALNDAIYNVASANSSLTVSIAATGQVTLTSVAATDALAGVSELATPAEVVTGTDTTRTVTPQGVRSAAVYKSDFNAKGDILSASANDTPVILPVGSNGQYLRADSTQGSGLTWDTLSAGDLVASPAINGNTNIQTILEDAVYNIASAGNTIVVSSTPTGLFNVEVRQATETQLGGAEVATQAEVTTGTDDTRMVTPLKLTNFITGGGIKAAQISLDPAINGNTTVQTALADAIYNVASANTSVTVTETATGQVNLAVTQATETQIGGGEVATQTETNTGTDDARFVTPLKLNNRVASETLSGIAEVATQVETNTGTDDTRIVTPLKLRTAITGGAINSSNVQLSTAINGNTTVQTALADAIYDVTSANASLTVAIAATGLVTLTSVSATDALAGVVELATPAEVVTGTSTTLSVTPEGVRSAAVYKSDFNAKGDILSASANDTPLILPVGSNAQFLVADNTTATGLRWFTLPSTVGVSGGVSSAGTTTITDNVTSTSINSALSANQGKLLQDQVNALLVANNLTLAGTVNGTGTLLYVTVEGAAAGFVVGSTLPAPAVGNKEYFVICEQAGTFTPPSSSSVTVTQGDWLLSTGTVWQLLDVGLNIPAASTTQAGIVELATDAETQTGTDATRVVTPAGLTSRTATELRTGIAELADQTETNTGTDDTRIVTPLKLRTAAVYKSDFNAKGDLLSASANDVPLILPVGADGNVLLADSASATGLRWAVIPAAPAIRNLDNISGSFNGVTTAFPLTIGAVAYSPVPTTNIAVYIGGVPQIPGGANAYTVSGSTITFTSAPPAGATFYAFTVS